MMSEKLVSERHLGVEALRILAMLMICTLHVLSQGGILKSVAEGTPQFGICWLLECVAYCGVNCYALISGFVGVKSSFKWSRLLLIWFEVLFYELSISLFFQLFVDSVMTTGFWINAFTPVLSDEYWFITAYFGMILISPFINHAFQTISKRLATQLVIALSVLFVFLAFVKKTATFGLYDGYCTLWLLFLYIIGAYVRCFVPPIKKYKYLLLPLFALVVLFSWCYKLLFTTRFISYVSPTIFLAAILIFLFFINTDIKSRFLCHIVSFVSPTTLGIYLIQTQPRVFSIYLAGLFIPFSTYPPFKMLLCILLSIFFVFIGCSMIDKVRIFLFDIVHVKSLATRLDSRLSEK